MSLPSHAGGETGLHSGVTGKGIAALVVVTVFVLSRAIAFWVGVRFDIGGLTWYWQFLEPELLATDLARSLYYLHMQPPSFNLFLGVMLKFFPANLDAAFAAVYLILGLVLSASLCVLMLKLGVRHWLSAALTILFMVSPATILYENYLFYTYPVAVALVLAALYLHRYLTTRRFGEALVFFALLGAVALTRSLFHLAWLVAVVALVLWAAPRLRRRTLAAAALPLLAVAGWYFKNLLVFGSFSASTWMGMSMWKCATWNSRPGERAALVADGVLSPVGMVKAFRPLEVYVNLVPPAPSKGVPALDRKVKAGGEPNFNNVQYIAISEQNKRDALAWMKHNPKQRLAGLVDALLFYFVPASDYEHLNTNRPHIAGLERVYDVLQVQLENLETSSNVRVKIPRSGIGLYPFCGLSLVFGLPVLLAFGCHRVWRQWPARQEHLAGTATVAFCCLTIAYVTLAGNVFELGENMRFRFLIDPLFLVLFGLLLDGLLNRRHRARARLYEPE